MAPSMTKSHDWLLFVGIALGVPLAAISELHSSDASKAVVFSSALLCLLGFNLYIAILIRSKKKRAGLTIPKTFWGGIFLLMVFSAVGTVWAGSYVAARNTYLAIALSGKPLNDIYPERKRLVVELYRNRLANSIEADKQIAEARKHPIAPSLYSPESFADKATIASVEAQFQRDFELDHAYFLKQQQAMADFEQMMAKVDPSYLRSWENSEAHQELADAAVDQLETEWFNETISLYDYAAAHTQEISLKNGQLVFASQGIRLAFGIQETRCQSIHEKLLERMREEALTHRKPAT